MTSKNYFEIQCECGAKIVTNKKKDWCTKCGNPVFHYPKDKRTHKLNKIYFMGAIAFGLGFMVYLFIEIILSPILG